MQAGLDRSSHRIASRRVNRAAMLLSRAGRELDTASRLADRYHSDRLHVLATGLRELSLPISKIASRLERGGAL
jgi:hypothetical protein